MLFPVIITEIHFADRGFNQFRNGFGAAQIKLKAVCKHAAIADDTIGTIEDVTHAELHGDKICALNEFDDVAALAAFALHIGVAFAHAVNGAFIAEILEHVLVIGIVQFGIGEAVVHTEQVKRNGSGHAGIGERPIGGVLVGHIHRRCAADSLGDLIRHTALHVAQFICAVLTLAVGQVFAVITDVKAFGAAAAGDGIADGEIAALLAVLIDGFGSRAKRCVHAGNDKQQRKQKNK